jgi:hypothetical protein
MIMYWRQIFSIAVLSSLCYLSACTQKPLVHTACYIRYDEDTHALKAEVRAQTTDSDETDANARMVQGYLHHATFNSTAMKSVASARKGALYQIVGDYNFNRVYTFGLTDSKKKETKFQAVFPNIHSFRLVGTPSNLDGFQIAWAGEKLDTLSSLLIMFEMEDGTHLELQRVGPSAGNTTAVRPNQLDDLTEGKGKISLVLIKKLPLRYTVLDPKRDMGIFDGNMTLEYYYQPIQFELKP